MLNTLFHSPEFWDDATYRAKVKTPLEFVASAVRAIGAEVDEALPLARQLGNMGMPLYGAQPPTGYSMKAETWVSSSSLLNRMNFALALTSGKIKGVRIDGAQLAGDGVRRPDASATVSTLGGKRPPFPSGGIETDARFDCHADRGSRKSQPARPPGMKPVRRT